MKIVNLEKFRSLPEGTVFMKYEPCVFGDLSVKGETWQHDWLYSNITYNIDCVSSDDFSNKLDDAENNGASLQMDFDCFSRDGCFDRDQLFAVYEKDDIDGLIERLIKCKIQAYK